MGRIVVIQLAVEPPSCKGFAVQLLLDRWRQEGHEIVVAAGTADLPDGDVALLHVNLSVVPPDYAAAARRYPAAINAGALDIRKRTVSRNILARGDPWTGAVIVKTDLNCKGVPECVAAARPLGRLPTDEEVKEWVFGYHVLPNIGAVPDTIWDEPRLVVERFLPERDARGHYLRTWIFLGGQECCRRFLAEGPLIKGNDYRAFEPCAVPEFLRAERARLGCDYGKFDFVIHEGEPILLDANKTMGIPPPSKPALRGPYAALAPGIEDFLGADAVRRAG